MHIFQVRQAATGAVLWTGAAPDQTSALDIMAHEAGYRDASELPASIRASGLWAEPLEL